MLLSFDLGGFVGLTGRFRETCVRVGLLALPLCGAAVTFFAAAKKVTKESSYPQPKHFTPAAAQTIG
ncbi:protein of unknown function [Caballeronia sp. S22]